MNLCELSIGAQSSPQLDASCFAKRRSFAPRVLETILYRNKRRSCYARHRLNRAGAALRGTARELVC